MKAYHTYILAVDLDAGTKEQFVAIEKKMNESKDRWAMLVLFTNYYVISTHMTLDEVHALLRDVITTRFVISETIDTIKYRLDGKHLEVMQGLAKNIARHKQQQIEDEEKERLQEEVEASKEKEDEEFEKSPIAELIT